LSTIALTIIEKKTNNKTNCNNKKGKGNPRACPPALGSYCPIGLTPYLNDENFFFLTFAIKIL
jgi:hypothetical protein